MRALVGRSLRGRSLGRAQSTAHATPSQPLSLFVFTDAFNRADENLETSANWTRVGEAAGDATVASNACAVPTTNSASVFLCPDIGSADHYVEADWMTVSHSAGPFIACRVTDVNNFVGARSKGNGSTQLFKRVAGTFTNLGEVLVGVSTPGDRLRLECNGDNARVLLNDVEAIEPASLAGSHAGVTRCGIVPRLIIINPWIDNFEAGAL